MARYTEKLTATIKYWYEETDRPIESIATEFDVSARNIQRLAVIENWDKRKDRKRKPRDVPAANLLLEQAMGLAARSLERPPTPNPSPPLASLVEGGELSAAERLEALVLKQIEAVEQGGTARPGRRTTAAAADRRARTLATLTQTLHTLQRLRAGEHESGNDDFDDRPRDIDEFRRDLARRIEAFVASRTDGGDAGEDAGLKPMDGAG